MPSGDVPISGGVVSVGITTGVCVTVGVAVAVDVCVTVGVDATIVGVSGGFVDGGCVFVGFGFRVGVGVHGMNTSVLVGLLAIVGVLVADEMVVGTGEDVGVVFGKGVPVMIDTPGVRNSSIHPGCVRMAGSTGSMNPLGRLATKVLFGSICDSISVFNCQLGAKRAASCPATITHTNPITKMMMTTIVQSSRSRSTTFMIGSIDRQSHKDSCAGEGRFVVPRALQPNPAAMGMDNAARDG